MMSSEDLDFDLRAVDGGAGGRRERGDSADVVEVAVGHEDRLDGGAEGVDLRQQSLGLLAGIHEQSWRARTGRPGRGGRSP